MISCIFIKPYYDYRVVSIYEYLQIRFGVSTKNGASAVFLLTRVLASGTRLYVAAVVLVLAVQMIPGVHPTKGQELAIYIGALTLVTLLTAVYTTVGGIKAVVWTDVIQASVMFGSLGFAIWILLHNIPGGWTGALAHLQGPNDLKVVDAGVDGGIGFWGNAKKILETEYTLWAAFLGSTFVTMATHGTDQDMVQRMLTAKDHRRSRLALVLSGLADIPVVMAFLFVGILLWVFYQVHPDPNLPTKNAHVFAYYILNQLPSGVRGLLVAGLFATAMGSLSTALNALATSFAKDWYVPYICPQADERRIVRAARWGTAGFAVLLIFVGAVTAWVVIMKPGSRIIPIVLGIFGYTYGSLLGVFLVGMLTKTRGSNTGNIAAMIAGFLFVAFMSGLHLDIMTLLDMKDVFKQPSWIPVIEFPWRVMFGTILTFSIAVLFRTPESQLQIVRKHLKGG